MINEVRKKLAKELNLALAERAREESALPTDLWKKPVSTTWCHYMVPSMDLSYIRQSYP